MKSSNLGVTYLIFDPPGSKTKPRRTKLQHLAEIRRAKHTKLSFCLSSRQHLEQNMSPEGISQKADKLPSISEMFPSMVSTKVQMRNEETLEYSLTRVPTCGKMVVVDATGSPSSSRSSECDGDNEMQSFSGNSLGQVQNSPSKSAETVLQFSPLVQTRKEAESHSYWDTVLGPSFKKGVPLWIPMTGSMKGPATADVSDEKPHTCSICPMSFKKRCNLVSHVSNVHEKIRPFQCNVCARTFARKSNCVKHVSCSASHSVLSLFMS